jgi:Tol biopolymer transport system component
MQFHLKTMACSLVLCAFGACVPAQQSAKPSAAAANPTTKPARQVTKQSLFKAQHFDQTAISPTGSAWRVEILSDEEGAPTGKQDIYVQEVSGSGKPIRVTAGAPATHSNEGHVAWSPDSRKIAFISDAIESGRLQLYVAGATGGVRTN